MGVGLGGARRIEVDHVVNARNVQPACGNVGRDEDVEASLTKAAHGSVSLSLAHIPLECDGPQTLLRELKRESLRTMLCSREHDRRLAIVLREQAIEQIPFPAFRHRIEGMFDSLGRSNRRQFHDMRSIENTCRQLANRLRHRGRKEQVLSILWQRGQNPFDVGKESHVKHMIRFIEYESLDLREIQLSMLQEIEHSTRTTDYDLGSTAQRANLRTCRDAAEDRHGLDLGEFREQPDFGIDLNRKLASRGQDEGQWALARLLEESLKNRQREGCRLSCTRLGQAHDVLPLEAGRHCIGLNRPGFTKTRGLEAIEQ